MGIWITAICPNCGDEQKQLNHKYRLWRCRTAKDRNYYTFNCLTCAYPAVKPAPAEVYALLVGGGVCVTPFDLPMELGDPQRRDGSPLSRDDLLDFQIDLAAWDGEKVA